MSHPAPKRTRDPARKQAAILTAARAVFAERGYEKATIREIARRAGVTHGLVVLHFATKEQLFATAMTPDQDTLFQGVLDDDIDGLPRRIATSFVHRLESSQGADPVIALIRSAAGDQQAAKALLHTLRRTATDGYAKVLDSPDLAARVDTMGAHLIGVAFSRYVLADGPLAAMPAGELIDRLTATIRTILLN
ncbi:TetR family transcriptional regulator [Paractinoplanes deccanensis]|uniref:TetR family transcriptional regulator n=1 Tax=Paractinoplanes deccanensis TaxID=113561 RepID=A0ABQ3XXV7_9ACTN|nr:TetR family transcriptional regulator [Actinoplanes deccanensis]GID72594.1 TetR family transcriptional regulator [Actinoplanes deccanensis]